MLEAKVDKSGKKRLRIGKKCRRQMYRLINRLLKED